MSNCCSDFAGGARFFLMAFARALLMAGSAIILITQLLTFWALCWVDDTVQSMESMVGMHISSMAYLAVLALAFLGLTGTYGAYTKNSKWLRVFALCALGIALIYVLLPSDINKHQWAGTTRPKVIDTMEMAASHYQYHLKPGKARNDATKLWDLMQTSLLCCGLRTPKDWSMWKITERDVLPDSCCISLSRAADRDGPDGGPKCSIENSFEDGCLERLDDLVLNAYKRRLLIAFIYTVLSLCAYALARESDAANSVANSPNAPTTNYQQFDGSVWIRHPSGDVLVRQQQQQAPQHVYPNLSPVKDNDIPPKYDHI